MEHTNEDLERISELEKDTEITARLLGSLGLVDATLYHYEDPTDAPNIFRGRE